MFRNRKDAALQLAQRLKARKLEDPVVLGIPRGGVVIAAILARELGGELDIVLSRKLRAPYQPELAIGAIGEDGAVYLNAFAREVPGVTESYIREEQSHQIAEIARRSKLFRAMKPQTDVAQRSVIITDDGIATGSTLLAALHVLNAQKPHEIIVAVPVAPPETLDRFRAQCSHVECVLAPSDFQAIGQFYSDFEQVEDEEVVRLLCESGAARTTSAVGAAKEDASMRLTSTAFGHNAAIPDLYTCEGKDVSPPLAWSGVPAGAKSLALIVDDPDAPDPAAPKMIWVHWVLYDIPPAATDLAQDVAPRELPQGTREGLNDWRHIGYGGPCPPIGRHRYFFKLYALDTLLPDLGRPTKGMLEKAMKGHILEQAELVGTYAKQH